MLFKAESALPLDSLTFTEGGAALIATHIDLGVDAAILDVGAFRARPRDLADFDGDFL